MKTAHYFVDESGDGVLFSAKGQVLLEQGSALRHFILGLLEVAQPEALAQGLHTLRTELLADPYFRHVPSMQAAQGKTALAFHAKDDVPEDVARSRFEQKWDRTVSTQIHLVAGQPAQHACLQAADYLLWALQRHYAQGESRYLELMWEKVSLVHAVDETHAAPYGRYYSKTKPLVGAALKKEEGI